MQYPTQRHVRLHHQASQALRINQFYDQSTTAHKRYYITHLPPPQTQTSVVPPADNANIAVNGLAEVVAIVLADVNHASLSTEPPDFVQQVSCPSRRMQYTHMLCTN